MDATLLDVTCCVRLHTLLHVVACCCAKFETGKTDSYVQTDATIPSIIDKTMYASSTLQSPSENWAKAACKWTRQFPTLLCQQCWELLRPCSQQCWDLQCIVGRIQPISLCKSCVRLRANGRNIAGQQLLTLFDVTCCVCLHTLLHVVGCCCLLLRKV